MKKSFEELKAEVLVILGNRRYWSIFEKSEELLDRLDEDVRFRLGLMKIIVSRYGSGKVYFHGNVVEREYSVKFRTGNSLRSKWESRVAEVVDAALREGWPVSDFVKKALPLVVRRAGVSRQDRIVALAMILNSDACPYEKRKKVEVPMRVGTFVLDDEPTDEVVEEDEAVVEMAL